MTADLDDFRATVRQWCRAHVPADWRAAQTGASDEEFVAFQKAWFAELHRAGLRRAALAAEWGGGMPVDRAGRALLRTGRPRRPAPGAGVRRDPPRGVDPAGRRHRRAASPPSPGDPRRRDLGPGVLRTRGRLRPGRPAHHGPPRRRPLRGQRPEALGQRRCARRLVPAAGPHRSGCPQAPRHLLLPAGHDAPGHRRPADPQRRRRLALLRDLPQRRADPGRQPRRRGEPRLAGGPGHPGRRARDDDAGAGRAAGQCRLRLAGAGVCPQPGPDGHRPLDDAVVRGPAGAVRDRDHRAARAVPRRGGGATRPAPSGRPTRRSSSCTTANCCSG